MKEWIWGRNPVFEVLQAGRRSIYQLRLSQGVKIEGNLVKILQLVDQQGIPVERVSPDSLNSISRNHQGLAMQVGPYPYVDLRQILERIEKSSEPALILVLDTLQDPQNLGTLIRTAELVGVHGLVLPLRRTATVTPAVVNASSGASEHMLITQSNLAQTLAQLKDEGLWVVGLESGEQAQAPDQVDLGGPLAVVVGSESQGMRRLVKEHCDFLLRLPMRGQIDSLNAAVAGSIVLYFVWQARDYRGARE
jgi:23S rRNA (guanosine2251-2'-O)-methyltransferase